MSWFESYYLIFSNLSDTICNCFKGKLLLGILQHSWSNCITPCFTRLYIAYFTCIKKTQTEYKYQTVWFDLIWFTQWNQLLLTIEKYNIATTINYINPYTTINYYIYGHKSQYYKLQRRRNSHKHNSSCCLVMNQTFARPNIYTTSPLVIYRITM